MNILIVDDNDEKRDHVVRALTDKLSSKADLQIRTARDYDEAIDALRVDFHDLVVLDLVLPGTGTGPSKETSRALIRQLMHGDRLMAPTNIIGLTAYEEVAEQERLYYSENLLALEFYDRDSTGWVDRIVARITYLVRSKDAALRFRSNSYDLDVFVLAARHENEFRPIKKALFSIVEADTHPMWRGQIALGTIVGPDGALLRAGLACVGEMGMAPTAAVATQAINLFRPRIIGMIGMCCGFSIPECSAPRKLLDAIVVREVNCWEEGKYLEQANSAREFLSRSRARMVDDRIRDQVDLAVEMAADTLTPALGRLAKKPAYKAVLAKFGPEKVRSVPEVKFAPIVSGSSVIADEAVIRQIVQLQPNSIGLDMEIYGLYAAVDKTLGAKPSVLGVKGVSDFGEAAKDDAAQTMASTVATTVFLGLLRRLNIFSSVKVIAA